MSNADRPQELPARLLTDPEMIEACRVRDFARVFRLLKVRAGIYPSMIARRCELTPSRVGEVIAGRRQLLHMDVVERIADGLRIPGHMLGLARREWETPQALAVAEREAPQVPEPEQQIPVSLPGPEVDSILALATRTSLSAATLEAFRSSIEDYWRRDDQHGGEALRPAVVDQLRHVVDPLKKRCIVAGAVSFTVLGSHFGAILEDCRILPGGAINCSTRRELAGLQSIALEQLQPNLLCRHRASALNVRSSWKRQSLAWA